jgi:hypothetical protein
MGGFEQPISVPSMDLKHLTTSSIVLASQLASLRGESDSGISHQGTMRRFQAMAGGYDPLVMGSMKVVPSIGNVFLARQTVYVYFHVYGAAEDRESHEPVIETDLMLIKDATKILETQPRYVYQWTTSSGGFLFSRASRGFGGPFPGGDAARGGRGMGGNFGRMGGPPGMPEAGARKGEATVAISMPLRNLRKGTYTLQVHVRDTVGDMDLFQRVPIVIQ